MSSRKSFAPAAVLTSAEARINRPNVRMMFLLPDKQAVLRG
jgi:hypothetical protein